MNYKLINPPSSFSATEQILYNRGIDTAEFGSYIHTTDNDINDFSLLNINQLTRARVALEKCMNQQQKIAIVVDSDCDGFTSAAFLINYLYSVDKEYVENNLDWIHHQKKAHGLKDCIDNITANNYSLVIVPDGGTNDYLEHKLLYKHNIECIILDHHEIEDNINIEEYQEAIIINNQLCDYPNKNFSGVGIVYQFCRYLDDCWNCTYSDDFIDLLAIGLTGDMMSLKEKETHHLIWKGLKEQSIRNPFISGIINKNEFSLNKAEYKSEYLKVSPMGAAFFIVPFINAITRSGTIEEKEIVFESFLTHKAFCKIPSNKRGHKLGEMETIVEQALRTVTNVKNRQTKLQDQGVSALEKEVDDKLQNHKALIFKTAVDPNVAGLIGNKIANKYQRPVCILNKYEEFYQGSARGYEKADIKNFKKICKGFPHIDFVAGHPNAFGISIPVNEIDNFEKYLDLELKDTPMIATYYVDYIFNGEEAIDYTTILDIAKMNDFWGKDFDRSQIAIENLKINSNMINVYTKNTVKITLANKVCLMIFNATDEQCEYLSCGNYSFNLTAIGECIKNEYMGHITPQIKIVDYILNFDF